MPLFGKESGIFCCIFKTNGDQFPRYPKRYLLIQQGLSYKQYEYLCFN